MEARSPSRSGRHEATLAAQPVVGVVDQRELAVGHGDGLLGQALGHQAVGMIGLDLAQPGLADLLVGRQRIDAEDGAGLALDDA